MIDVTLIGTSSLLPIPERALSSAFLSCEGRSVLFDCGEGTQTAARKAGVNLMKTDIIALTHYHGDHIFGLPGLLQTMHSMGRTQPLYITGPEGLERELAPIIRLTGQTSYEIRLIHLPDEGLSLSELDGGRFSEAKLTPFVTEHRTVSQGYCFTLDRAGRFMPDKAEALGVPVSEWKNLQHGQCVNVNGVNITPEQVLGESRRGLKVVFTGDTMICDSLINASRDADLLICDATYAEDGQAELAAEHGHMNFAQAAKVASKSGVKRLWLTHFSQMIEQPEEFLKNAAFENTVCGYDGLTVSLYFEEQDGI